MYKFGKAVTAAEKSKEIVYHLEAQLENVCFETTYTDPHYQSEGFVLGRCDESYNTLINKTAEVICNGHSEENVRASCRGARGVWACLRVCRCLARGWGDGDGDGGVLLDFLGLFLLRWRLVRVVSPLPQVSCSRHSNC